MRRNYLLLLVPGIWGCGFFSSSPAGRTTAHRPSFFGTPSPRQPAGFPGRFLKGGSYRWNREDRCDPNEIRRVMPGHPESYICTQVPEPAPAGFGGSALCRLPGVNRVSDDGGYFCAARCALGEFRESASHSTVICRTHGRDR